MNRFIRTTLWLTLAAALFAAATLPQAATAIVRHVKPTASGTEDGSSWGNASNDLQAMINVSATGDEIWVYKGTYKPQYTADRWNGSAPYPDTDGIQDNAFVLKAGVKVYGGFAGNEVSLAARDWKTNVTVLSGDMGTDSCYHVVIGANIPDTDPAVLDGFTVSGGNADGGSGDITVNGRSIYRNNGGGIYNYESSPVLNDVTVSGNLAQFGGGIYNYSSSPRLTNVTISKNYNGGGICNDNSSPVLTNVTIRDNTANSTGGGGIYNTFNSSPVLTNVAISGNTAYNGGGIYNDNSSPQLTGVTLSGNQATGNGGGIYNYSSSPRLTNVTVSGNQATGNGGGIYNARSSSPRLTNTIVWRNGTGVYNDGSGTPVYAYSLVEGENPGDTNLDGTDAANDPQFVSPLVATDAPTAAGDYRLQATSPVIDRGNNAAYLIARGLRSFTGETDLAGLTRLSGDRIDLGAYEYKGVPAVDILDFDLGDVVYAGRPVPVTVTAAGGIRGLGDITVRYDGLTRLPYEPGTYTVTVDIAEGTGYLAAESLWLGTFTILAPPRPDPVPRRVQLPAAAGLTTDPPAGLYFVNSGSSFTFRLTPAVPSPDGAPPTVRTNRTDVPGVPESDGLRITPNGDGSYTVVIRSIRQNIDVSLSAGTDSESATGSEASAAALTVTAVPGAIAVGNARSEAVVLRVYTLTGALVHRITAAPGATRLTVAPGVYIVVTADGLARWKLVING
jgi:parallel beta-helix repeat protein